MRTTPRGPLGLPFRVWFESAAARDKDVLALTKREQRRYDALMRPRGMARTHSDDGHLQARAIRKDRANVEFTQHKRPRVESAPMERCFASSQYRLPFRSHLREEPEI